MLHALRSFKSEWPLKRAGTKGKPVQHEAKSSTTKEQEYVHSFFTLLKLFASNSCHLLQ